MEMCAVGVAVSQASQTRVGLRRDESLINMPLLIHEHELSQSGGKREKWRDEERHEGKRYAEEKKSVGRREGQLRSAMPVIRKKGWGMIVFF